MKWYLRALRKYAVFSGRARRKEFWMFVLFDIIFSFGTLLLVGLNNDDEGVFVLIFVVYTLAMILPGLAVSVRRLHDVGQSGWMILVALIPVIGYIWLFILLVMDSDKGANEYGDNPKGIEKDTIEINNPAQTFQSRNNFSTPPIPVIPAVCPHCKSPNTKGLTKCEWCGGKIC